MQLDSQNPITSESLMDSLSTPIDSTAQAAQPALEHERRLEAEPNGAAAVEPSNGTSAASHAEPEGEPHIDFPVAAQAGTGAEATETDAGTNAELAESESMETAAETSEMPVALEDLIEQYSQTHQAPTEGEIFEGWRTRRDHVISLTCTRPSTPGSSSTKAP